MSSARRCSSSPPARPRSLAIPWLQRAHLIADTPLWLLVGAAARVQRRRTPVVQTFEKRLSPDARPAPARRDRRDQHRVGRVRDRVGLDPRDRLRRRHRRPAARRTDRARGVPGLFWSGVAIFARRDHDRARHLADDPAPVGRARGRGHHVPLPRAHRAHARLVGRGRGEGHRADRARPVVLPRSRAARGRRDRAREPRLQDRLHQPGHRAARGHRAAVVRRSPHPRRARRRRGRGHRPRVRHAHAVRLRRVRVAPHERVPGAAARVRPPDPPPRRLARAQPARRHRAARARGAARVPGERRRAHRPARTGPR